ncbi:hypothetical protein FVR03_23700 [Pontibacter qinzhouensis]|uniref:Outer membrane beta-barrel protein n=1 Tax=Pontibacter qinzhouensis TaxID=2603253 RepID=A0A5C8IIK9_9BACT|nr:hypothetical protein [Pontibacter qinzhouensis]TXK21001.1 hypothetical protein FVR03_23700 [Pontibacter qinzhouensis]
MDRTTQFINLGLGFHGPAYHSGRRPAYMGSVDVGIMPNVTVGVSGSYFRRPLSEPSQYSAYSVGIRASYYVNSLLNRHNKKMDYYLGAGVSYYSFTYSGLVSNKGNVFVPAHVGARRLFGERYGVFGELGFNDIGFLKIGLTQKW